MDDIFISDEFFRRAKFGSEQKILEPSNAIRDDQPRDKLVFVNDDGIESFYAMPPLESPRPPLPI